MLLKNLRRNLVMKRVGDFLLVTGLLLIMIALYFLSAPLVIASIGFVVFSVLLYIVSGFTEKAPSIYHNDTQQSHTQQSLSNRNKSKEGYISTSEINKDVPWDAGLKIPYTQYLAERTRLINDLRSMSNQYTPQIMAFGKTLTPKEMSEEILQQTTLGKNFVEMMVKEEYCLEDVLNRSSSGVRV